MPWKEHTSELTNAQALAMSLALHIRNDLEDLHAQGRMDDGLMAELNVAIRYSVHDYFARVVHDEHALDFLERSIPHYWEVPGIDPRPTFTGEPLWQGKPIKKPEPNGSGNLEDL